MPFAFCPRRLHTGVTLGLFAVCHLQPAVTASLKHNMATTEGHTKRRKRANTLQQIEYVDRLRHWPNYLTSVFPCRRTDPDHHLAGGLRPQTYVLMQTIQQHNGLIFLSLRQSTGCASGYADACAEGSPTMVNRVSGIVE